MGRIGYKRISDALFFEEFGIALVINFDVDVQKKSVNVWQNIKSSYICTRLLTL